MTLSGKPSNPSLDTIIASIENIIIELQAEPGLSAAQRNLLATLISELASIRDQVNSLMHGD